MKKSKGKFYLSKEKETRIIEGLIKQDPNIEKELYEIFLPIFLHLLKRWGFPRSHKRIKRKIEEISGLEYPVQEENLDIETETEIETEESSIEDTVDEEPSDHYQIVREKDLDDRFAVANEAFLQVFKSIRRGRLVVNKSLYHYLKRILYGKYIDYLVNFWKNPKLKGMYNVVKDIRKKQKELISKIGEIESSYISQMPKGDPSSNFQWEEIEGDLRVYVLGLDVDLIPEPLRHERIRLYKYLNELYEEEKKAIDEIVAYEYKIRTSIDAGTDWITAAPPSKVEQIENIVKDVTLSFPENEQPIIVDYYERKGKQPGYRKIARKYGIPEEEVRRIIAEFRKKTRLKLEELGGYDL